MTETPLRNIKRSSIKGSALLKAGTVQTLSLEVSSNAVRQGR